MIRLLFLLLLVIGQVSCQSNKRQKQLTDKRPVFRVLVAGKTSEKYLHASNIVGKQYGLVYQVVGACSESNSFYDSLSAHNKIVFAQLAREFGTNWKNEFDTKVDSMEFLISQAESIVRLETDYEKKERQFVDKGIVLALRTEPFFKNDVFSVKAYKIPLLLGDSNRNVYFSWTVDVNKHKIVGER